MGPEREAYEFHGFFFSLKDERKGTISVTFLNITSNRIILMIILMIKNFEFIFYRNNLLFNNNNNNSNNN